MATITSFEDVKAWQAGRALALKIYRVTNKPSFLQDDALCDALRQAALAVSSRIASGFEQRNDARFADQLRRALGATGAIRSQMYVALDAQYVTQPDFDAVARNLDDTRRMIQSLLRYLNV